MAGGISDIYFTSLRLAKGETVAEAAPVPLARAPGITVGGGDAPPGNQAAVDGLTAGLASRLGRFENALSRFAWPAGNTPWSAARLVVASPGLDASVSGVALPSGQAVNPFKFFSNGKSALAASGIPAGDYALRLDQGPSAGTFSVTVGARDTWGQVLGKVAEAVNDSANLSVRADVTRQQKPFTLDPSLAAVGTVLALSVNPLRREQDVALADVSGDLVSRLGIKAVPDVAAPAPLGTVQAGVERLAAPAFLHSTGYDPNATTGLATGLHTFALAVGSGAQPTSYVSTVFDPDAATTLAPKTYTFGLALGGNRRSLSVTVKAGWTWGDVQNAVAGQINATPTSTWSPDGTSTVLVAAPSFSLPGVAARTSAAAMPAATGAASVAGRVLTVATQAGAAGEVLALTDGQGGILAALGLTTPLRGTVLSVAVAAGDTAEDVLGNLARTVALATGRVDAATRHAAIPATNVPGRRLSHRGVTADLLLRNRRLGESLTLADGATGLLASLGLDAKLPGQDGRLTIDNQPLASENNAYALASGRVVVTARADTGQTLPLSVTRAMDAVESRLTAVVDAYNDLRKYLDANAGFFTGALADGLERPVTGNWSGLAALGFARTRSAGRLWIATDTLWRSLYADGQGARHTLVGAPSSLIPAWKGVVATAKAAGAGSFLTPETTHLSRVAPRRTASDLERRNWLVDLEG
ncbi:hypothetical protein DFW101_2918 [Solidesulfovibrio carbinoliphilus subsp. oakridgensis]|uniref:Uncharacterized protein n=1 Tax=Solidesulfovibrio carbinoliphilus subsp. oakridgensis TaxID=694327 RepID=G7Q5B9_9BACT|nr:hypothetical protein [Solidesulfovibrio carbinoliphilus]EHJ48920.1 hypothetical protein DFW101_2918 [Solidesulfovibrio carbinoliphilus subsp. oakridgensis]